MVATWTARPKRTSGRTTNGQQGHVEVDPSPGGRRQRNGSRFAPTYGSEAVSRVDFKVSALKADGRCRGSQATCAGLGLPRRAYVSDIERNEERRTPDGLPPGAVL